MKSGKVDSVAKVPLGPVPHSVVTDSSSEKEKSALIGNYERSIKAREFPEVCALLNVDLLEDVDACAKIVDSIGKVIVCSNSFVKRPTYRRRSSLIARMHKTLILAIESMCINHDVVECAKEAEVALMAQLRLLLKR
ncbi:hypothetical protein ACFX2F_034968 [Malus domestica]